MSRSITGPLPPKRSQESEVLAETAGCSCVHQAL